jgi:hypothetical protein
MLATMQLQNIKLSAAVGWSLTTVAVGTVIDLTWSTATLLAAFAFLPPLALLLLWNEPSPTMSERIRNARR